jgi:hypothetical protein
MVRFKTMLLLAALCTTSCMGCLPRTLVKKNPGPDDCGVRYYRPKPYLMVKPAVNKNGEPVPGYVSLEPTTLPDFSEEYSIHIRPGLGSNETNITLEDGWKLTGLNVAVDSKFDENLAAVAEVAKGIPTSGDFGPEHRIEVRGMNVPLGLYESVIANDGCQKRLYGFRYVGFLPFSGCPVEMSGCQNATCEEAAMYGLVFDQEANVMVFKLLHEISENKTAKREVILSSSTNGPKQDADAELEDNSETAPTQ